MLPSSPLADIVRMKRCIRALQFGPWGSAFGLKMHLPARAYDRAERFRPWGNAFRFKMAEAWEGRLVAKYGLDPDD